MVTEDDISPNSQFLLVCANRDAGAGLLRYGGRPGLRPSRLARRASRRAGLQPGLLVRPRGSGGRRAAQPPLRLPPGHVRLKTAHAHPQHQPPRRSAVPSFANARKKIKQKHRTKFRVQFLSSPGWRRLLTVTYYHPGTTISMYLSTLPSSFHV